MQATSSIHSYIRSRLAAPLHMRRVLEETLPEGALGPSAAYARRERTWPPASVAALDSGAH
eukprot:10149841-Alexandrium_andersonii.AAC.1